MRERHSKIAGKRAARKAELNRVLVQQPRRAKTPLSVGPYPRLYARPAHPAVAGEAMRDYAGS